MKDRHPQYIYLLLFLFRVRGPALRQKFVYETAAGLGISVPDILRISGSFYCYDRYAVYRFFYYLVYGVAYKGCSGRIDDYHQFKIHVGLYKGKSFRQLVPASVDIISLIYGSTWDSRLTEVPKLRIIERVKLRLAQALIIYGRGMVILTSCGTVEKHHGVLYSLESEYEAGKTIRRNTCQIIFCHSATLLPDSY